MSLYAIGDLHLSLGASRPMDVFEGWQNYVDRLRENWCECVRGGDTVVLLGDISWADSLEQAKEDFAFVDALPGRKIILKGNHDYWWNTRTKMCEWMAANGFSGFDFLHNNCFESCGVSVCGTRGWLSEDGNAADEKVLNREVCRLRASLQSAPPQSEKIVFLHYPPIYLNSRTDSITDVLAEFGVRRCYYGHIHGKGIPYAVNRTIDGVAYKLLSADALGFKPYKIAGD